jgi:hypothetical protein
MKKEKGAMDPKARGSSVVIQENPEIEVSRENGPKKWEFYLKFKFSSRKELHGERRKSRCPVPILW